MPELPKGNWGILLCEKLYIVVSKIYVKKSKLVVDFVLAPWYYNRADNEAHWFADLVRKKNKKVVDKHDSLWYHLEVVADKHNNKSTLIIKQWKTLKDSMRIIQANL